MTEFITHYKHVFQERQVASHCSGGIVLSQECFEIQNIIHRKRKIPEGKKFLIVFVGHNIEVNQIITIMLNIYS